MKPLLIKRCIPIGLLLLLYILVQTSQLYAQSAGIFQPSPTVGTISRSDEPFVVQESFVQVDTGQIDADVFELQLNFFENADFSVEQTEIEQNASGSLTWFGQVIGDEESKVILVINEDVLVGNVAVGADHYQIRYAGDGVHAVYKMDQGQYPLPGEPLLPEEDEFSIDEEEQDILATDNGSVLDIMVAYTTRSRQAAGGTRAMAALIDLAIAETNQAYRSSGVIHRLNLVHRQEMGYGENGSYGQHLSRLRNKSDGVMDSIHTLRDRHRADVVSLFVTGRSYCGIGYVMTKPSVRFENAAFNVVNLRCATGYYSFAHEIGHNLGLMHDRANSRGIRPAYSYGYGYQAPNRSFRTIMAYNCPGGCPRIKAFSNPAVTFRGMPIGVDPRRNRNQSAHNALAMNNVRKIAANWRSSSNSSCSTSSSIETSVPPAISEPIEGIFAQSTQQSGIFEPSPTVGTISRSDEPFVVQESFVQVDVAQIDANALTLRLNLFEDADFSAQQIETQTDESGGRTWIGQVVDDEESSIVLVIQDDIVVGNIFVNDGQYQIRYAGDGVHAVYKIDQNQFPLPGEPLIEEEEKEDEDDEFTLAEDESLTTTASDDGSVLDIMILYTPQARQSAGGSGAMAGLVRLAIAESNLAYKNSGVTYRLNLVHQQEVNYAENGSYGQHLSRLTNKNDGYMDSIHNLRDTHRADIVSLFINSRTYCGMGYLMTSPSARFENRGFNVVTHICVSNNTLAHEIGHNLGLMHDRRNSVGSTPAYSYGYGYQVPNPRVRTVMAYNCSSPGCPKIKAFSNPYLTYRGTPIGVNPRTNARSSAYAVLAMNNVRKIAANWRSSCRATSQLSNDLSTAVMVMQTDDLSLKQPGDLVEIPVWVETNGSAVNSATAHLDFDPAMLEVTDVQLLAEAELPEILQTSQIDNSNGSVSFSRRTSGEPVTRSFELAVVTMQIKQPTTAEAISFSDETSLTGAEGENVLADTWVEEIIALPGLGIVADEPSNHLYLPLILRQELQSAECIGLCLGPNN